MDSESRSVSSGTGHKTMKRSRRGSHALAHHMICDVCFVHEQSADSSLRESELKPQLIDRCIAL